MSQFVTRLYKSLLLKFRIVMLANLVKFTFLVTFLQELLGYSFLDWLLFWATWLSSLAAPELPCWGALLLWGPRWCPGLSLSSFPQGALEVRIWDLAYHTHDWWLSWCGILSWKLFSLTISKALCFCSFLSFHWGHAEEPSYLALKPLSLSNFLVLAGLCLFLILFGKCSLLEFHAVLWYTTLHSWSTRPFELENSSFVKFSWKIFVPPFLLVVLFYNLHFVVLCMCCFLGSFSLIHLSLCSSHFCLPALRPHFSTLEVYVCLFLWYPVADFHSWMLFCFVYQFTYVWGGVSSPLWPWCSCSQGWLWTPAAISQVLGL